MTNETWGIILIVYGVLCAYILLLKPPFIWKMKKFEVLIKMMGEKGFTIFLALWTLAAFTAGIIVYNL